MARRQAVLIALALVTAMGTTSLASAHHDGQQKAQERSFSSEDLNDLLLDPAHHGPKEGHLPPDVENVELVSRLRLTDKADAIADVGYFKGYAYLNAWFPNCPERGGTGGGVHVVDVRDPANPKKVGFLPSEANAVPGEGIHIMEVHTPSFNGDLLLHNNEQCDPTKPATLGTSIWDVTNPLAPKKIGQFGDNTPVVSNTTYHSIHSVQGFTQPGKAFAVLVDNVEFPDVDIIDITNPAAAKMASETDLTDWPGAESPLANGEAAFIHDLQFKRIAGQDLLAVSYWDAGQVLLNVADPSNPKFLGDHDYPGTDPESKLSPPEGNSHESYWSSNNQYLLSSDEDFAAYRLQEPGFQITSGPNSGGYPGGEFSWTVPISSRSGSQVNGSVVYGGRGCNADAAIPTADSIAAANPGFWGAGEERTVVISRGVCTFSEKVNNGQNAGYDVVIIGNHHTGSGNGTSPDAALCGSQTAGFPPITVTALCIGHRAMHLIFNDTPEYTPETDPQGADVVAIGTLGEDYLAKALFDGWGYVWLHDATKPNLPILDHYVIPEAMDQRFVQGFGDLTVHEVKTDPRPNVNLAYFAYYGAGFRVAEFDGGTITEVGRYIATEGNDFWGVFPIGDEYAGHGYPNPANQPYTKPMVLASDRHYGLYIFRYTGSAGICSKQEVTALGTTGADQWTGTAGNDVVKFLDGNDRANGGQGKDRLCGDAGKDKLRGGPKRDILVGGPGKGDVCNGGPGRDKFRGCEKRKN